MTKEIPKFYSDYLAEYHYDIETNEVYIYPKNPVSHLEATVLMEVLVDLFKELLRVSDGGIIVGGEKG